MNRLRSYKIFIDGAEAGSVSNGSSEELIVAPGDHKIQCRLSWYYSPQFDVSSRQDEIIYLRTRSSLRLYWPLYFLLIAGLLIGFFLKKSFTDYRPVWLIWAQFATILPFVLYMLYYLTLGRKNYLMIEEDKENVFAS